MTTPVPEALTLKTSTSEELEDWPVIATLFVNVLALAKEPFGSTSDNANLMPLCDDELNSMRKY